MRTLQDLIRESRPFTEEDPVKSQLYFWSSLLVFFVFWSVATAPLYWPVRAFFSVLSGLTVVRLFIFYHDFLHGAIFRNTRFTKWVMWTFGVLILNPPNVWKRSHNYHHQHNAQMATASIGSFPIMTTSQWREASLFNRVVYRFTRSPWNILVGYVTIFMIGMCLRSFLTDPKRHADSLLALVVQFLLGWTLYYLGGGSLLFFGLILPMCVSCSSGAYLFYVQHNFPGVQLRPRAEWEYVFAALKSSSFMDGSPITHWFTANIGYHHVHHLNSRIPFYRLPEAMEAIPELREPVRTTLHPLDIYRSFQLKLWDPALQEMVGFPPTNYLPLWART